jgi:protein-L-isoaspartate O-methyltransferase
VYSVTDYLWMIADEARVAAYAGALRALVRPGDRVLEVGSGFGFFSVIAARAGASRVYAVDTNPAVHLGPRIAEANGCGDRITFHHVDARLFCLEEPVDVMVLDLRGPTPFGPRSLQTLIDARGRFLRPGGTIIARRDTLFVAPAEAPEVFRREVQAAHDREGVVLDAAERIACDMPMRCVVAPSELLAAGVAWTEIDYRSVDTPDHHGEAQWTFDRRATVEGLIVWFSTDAGAGYGFSSGPEGAANVYRQIFLPFRNAVDVAAGTSLRAALDVRQVAGAYVWEWRGWRRPSAGLPEELVVQQNSLAEVVTDPDALRMRAPGARPSLGPRGRALRILVESMNGTNNLAALGAAVRMQAPGVFPDEAAAMEFVEEWCGRIGRLERGLE